MEHLVAGKTNKGSEYLRFTMTEDEFRDLTNDYNGLCVFCGEEAFGVEPDARHYECEGCSKKGVYGAEELLIMGLISFDE
jgi:hypothetical protein